jgi:hypothetical protein
VLGSLDQFFFNCNITTILTERLRICISQRHQSFDELFQGARNLKYSTRTLFSFFSVLLIRIGFNADPDTDPDPAFLVNADTGTVRIRIQIQGFDDQKFTAEKNIF